MILDPILGMFSTDMGIDLGTCNTLVCVRGQGIVLNEPSVVAVKRGTNRVLQNGNAVGLVAKEMLGKTPGSISAIRPMKDGVIADFDITEAMLSYFIRKVHRRRSLFRPRVVIAIPSGITAVEKRAVLNSAERAGARKVYLVDEPMACGIGAELPITEATASMIVDIGGGTTDIAIMSFGGVLYSRSIRTAGRTMDEAIVNYVRYNHRILIGATIAEAIKKESGTAITKANGSGVAIHIRGRDMQRGLPAEITLRSHDIANALSLPIQQIVGGIQQAMAEVPPELAADVCESGIYLTGGGALLDRIDVRLFEETGVRFKIADDPLRCVVRGTGIALENLDTMGDFLIKP